MVYVVAWNPAQPVGGNPANLIWQYIQQSKAAPQERFDDIFGTSGAEAIDTADPYRPIKFKMGGTASDVAASIWPGEVSFAIRNDDDDADLLFIDAATGHAELSNNLEVGGQGYSLRHEQTVSGAATTVDFNTGNIQTLLLEDSTVLTFSNPADGATYLFELAQDVVGSRLVTWPATVEWAGGSAPTLTATADKLDLISMYYNADKAKYYGVIAGQDYDV